MYNAAVDLIERNLQAGRADKIAFIDDDGSYSFAQLAERVERCANAYRALGVRPGDRVLLGLLDSIAFPTAFLGAIRAGIIPVPVNTMFSVADYTFILERSGATAAIVSQALYGAYAAAARSGGSKIPFIIANGSEVALPQFDALWQSADRAGDVAPTTADSACFWLYSSGSTGRPKATVHRHASLVQTAETFAQHVLGLQADDVIFSAAKLFFAYGLGNALTFPLAVGATAILFSGRPVPEAVVNVLVHHRPSIFCGVPTLFSSLLGSSQLRRAAPFALRLCTSAGEALPEPIGRAWLAATGVTIVDGIGSTEMLHIFVSNHPNAVTYGSSGFPVPGYSVRIVDEKFTDVGPGELGELLVKGPSAFSEYWGDPERTAAAFVGDWIRTGDKFVRKSSGQYVHCGRVDDMIKAGGIWVSPTEVESALMTHEAVQEVGVVGVLDSSELMKPKAFVVVRPGVTADDALRDDLRQFVKDRLAPYKYPRWIEFVDELPKTATGKIQRHVLRARDRAEHVARA